MRGISLPIIPELTPFTPEREAVEIFKAHNIRVHKNWDDRPDYLDDHHFRLFLLASINTLEDAEAMCKQLDSECLHEHCAKARIIRQWLSKPNWQRDVNSIRWAIASNRLVCCWGHESRSFAKRRICP